MKDGKLVDKKQVFGSVEESKTMGGQGATAQYLNKRLSAKTEIGNNGADHGPSFADKNPGAMEQATKHGNNPFFFVGMSFPNKKG